MEQVVFRNGRENVNEWNASSKLPVGWAAIVSMVIGLIGAGLGFAQVFTINGTTTPITGPIGGLINKAYGMDVGFELAVVFAAISYLLLRRIELNNSPRGELSAGGE